MDNRRDKPPYTYREAGYNGFMRRSLDSAPVNTLREASSGSRRGRNVDINFDHSQTTGQLGDVIQAGKAVRIDQNGLHLIDSEGNEILLAGFPSA